MSAPIIHARSSVKRFGGVPEDYIEIHRKMDCHKGYAPDNRGRVLTHTSFWVHEVMVPLFGDYIVNSDGKQVPVHYICEQHILEDYRMKFIPVPSDFIAVMEMQPWMNNGIEGVPPSAKLLNSLEYID